MTSDYLLLIAQFIGLNTLLNYEFLILMLQKFQIRNCSFYLSALSDTKSPEMCMLIYTTFAQHLYHILWQWQL